MDYPTVFLIRGDRGGETGIAAVVQFDEESALSVCSEKTGWINLEVLDTCTTASLGSIAFEVLS